MCRYERQVRQLPAATPPDPLVSLRRAIATELTVMAFEARLSRRAAESS